LFGSCINIIDGFVFIIKQIFNHFSLILKFFLEHER
jgi:hypothetical protein